MFSVHCAGHGARVILTARNITGVVNSDRGIEVVWRCPCGTEGVDLMGQEAVGRVS